MKMAGPCLIVLLGIGVLLQILGAPVSFLDLNGSYDDFISSVLIGACIIEDPHISLLRYFFSVSPTLGPPYSFLHEGFLFHPPKLAVST